MQVNHGEVRDRTDIRIMTSDKALDTSESTTKAASNIIKITMNTDKIA